ncbi:FAD binding domain-containing protein [Hirsutella rhossiliensis]|uniref:FAD binding domain-containing protein n=1 Tax=Hirsutella rhossiliensis TaxID=111463 RepID=A0A9P8SG14_9HYPO|nr:FAD binding domain-containing protein [Hirsutella rhossiliensis]KAH0959571.1 FAD binding domain-containing protein [Hirsutella rhossiliensis]
MRFLLALLLWGLAGAAATPPPRDVAAVCSTLYSKYPENLVWDPAGTRGFRTAQRAAVYNAALLDYWNVASAANRPACALFPSDAEQVSFAVQTLNAHPSVPFALKGGGHNPNLGFSSVSGGLLIAFRPKSQFAVPAPDGETVHVGAGAKWDNVYSALQPLGKTAVGGRLSDVGVTGFMLGGGLSYLSAQYGFACDNVVSFECVLANGTIVQASPTSHLDLFFALRGGGNQYAIVTSMTLKTYDIGDNGIVWGGIRIYTADKASKILSAVSSFTANTEDPKAAIIPNFIFIGAVGVNLPVALVFFFYDGPRPPAGVFDEFNAIPHLASDTESKSYLSLTREALGGDMKGLRFQIRENTFPNMPMPAMLSFLNDHFQEVLKLTTAGALADLIDIRLLTFAVQPMPRGIAEASRRVGGGNALGLVPGHGDRLWIEYDLAWTSPLCDKKCPAFLKKTAETMLRRHKQEYADIPPTNYVGGDLGFASYNPIFMNDAMADQNVLQSYGDGTYQRLKAIHQDYDPDGFFSTRQGGFKFST